MVNHSFTQYFKWGFWTFAKRLFCKECLIYFKSVLILVILLKQEIVYKTCSFVKEHDKSFHECVTYIKLVTIISTAVSSKNMLYFISVSLSPDTIEKYKIIIPKCGLLFSLT